MGRVVYPKKDPGYTIVRTDPQVNNGLVNNELLRKYYNTKINGSNRIGRLTGKTATEAVANYLYVWYEVMTVIQIAGRIIERKAWIREDSFSYYYNNEEKQIDPQKQRIAYAQQQATATQKAINATGLMMQELESTAKTKQLSGFQKQAINNLNNQYAGTLTKLKSIGGVKLRGNNLKGMSGLGIIPIIILVVVVAAVLIGYGIAEWVKWSVNMKQVENEALTQQELIKAQIDVLNNPNSTADQKSGAASELQKLNDASISRSKELIDNNKENSMFGNIKQLVILGVGGLIAFNLIRK